MALSSTEECKQLTLHYGDSLKLGFGDYTVGNLLGRGSFGCVFCLTESGGDGGNGSSIAVKFFSKHLAEAAAHEVKLLHAGAGSRTVRMLHSGCISGHAFIAMEEMLVDMYDLQARLQTRGKAGFGLPSFCWLGRQLAAAVNALHEKNVLHGDIKPENILISHGKPYCLKLADLSNACLVHDGPVHGTRTSRNYRSPAQLLGLPFSLEDDLWSVGCVLHEWHTGAALLPGQDDDEQLGLVVGLLGLPSPALIADSNRRCHYFRSTPTGWTFAPPLQPVRAPAAALRPLLAGLLCYENRLTATQLAQHPFWSERS